MTGRGWTDGSIIQTISSMFQFLSYNVPSSAMGPGGTFGYAEVNMAGHMACIQIGTHGLCIGFSTFSQQTLIVDFSGSLTQAELEEIAQGGPRGIRFAVD